MVKKATKTTKTTKTAKAKKPVKAAAAKTKKTATKSTKAVAAKVTDKKPAKKLTAATLYAWNKWLALFYVAQGVAILILSTTQSLPVFTSFLTKDTFVSKPDETPVLAPAVEHLFDVNMAYLVAATLFVAGLTHIMLATVYRRRYELELVAKVNRVRWAGFGVAAALSIVVVGLISGVYDISLLGMMAVSVIVGSLAGLAIEVYGRGVSRRRLVYVMCWIAAVAPWAVVGAYLLGANVYGSGDIPAYVYGIYGSITVLLLGIALSMYFQFKKRGKWADYLYADRAFIILTFIALSALAWQVFAGLL
jgi:hypothetical protein